MNCTDMCKLAACDNQPLFVELDDDSLDEGDPSDEEQEYWSNTFVISFQTIIFCYKWFKYNIYEFIVI